MSPNPNRTQRVVKLDSGSLWNRQKQSEKQPDIGGTVVVSRELLESLLADINSGREAKMDVAGWWRTSQQNEPYVSINVRRYMTKEEYEASRQRSAAPRPGF